MTIGGTFAAMLVFIRTSWRVILTSMVLTILIAAVLGIAVVGPSLAVLFDQNLNAPTPNPFVTMRAMLGLWLLLVVAALLFNAASMLSWRHGLTDGAEPVTSNIGWSMAAGGMSMLAWYAVSTAASMALYVVLILIGLVVFAILAASGATATDFGSSDPGVGLAVGVVVAAIAFYLLIIVAMYWLKARFSVSGPIMAARRTINPIDGYLESWRMTKAWQWKIVGLYFVELAIVTVVMVVVAVSVVALMAIAPDSEPAKWTALGLVGLVAAAFSIPLLLMSVATPPAIYRQIGAVEPADEPFS